MKKLIYLKRVSPYDDAILTCNYEHKTNAV